MKQPCIECAQLKTANRYEVPEAGVFISPNTEGESRAVARTLHPLVGSSEVPK